MGQVWDAKPLLGWVCSLWPSSRVGSQCCSGSPCLRLPVLLAKLEDAAFKPRLLPPLGLLCWLFFFLRGRTVFQ